MIWHQSHLVLLSWNNPEETGRKEKIQSSTDNWIIREAYERDIFTAKDKQFKSRAFLKEAKVYMMDYINTLLPENYPKLTIFDDEEVYLPMLKIGKNNPKEAEIKAANELRKAWN